MVEVGARVRELRTAIVAGVIQLEISNHNARVQALQDVFDRVRHVIDTRSKDKKEPVGFPQAHHDLISNTTRRDSGEPTYFSFASPSTRLYTIRCKDDPYGNDKNGTVMPDRVQRICPQPLGPKEGRTAT